MHDAILKRAQFPRYDVRFGFCLPSAGHLATPEILTSLGERAEELGFFAVSCSDHIVIPETSEAPYPYSVTKKATFPPDCIELFTALSFLAAKTSKVKLMTSIMVLPHRNPVLAAKILASLDVFSGGRVIVGAGAGWLEEEFVALGVPPFKERGRVSEEYINVFRTLWGTEISSFEGTFTNFSSVVLSPKPVQGARIPIWVGGESPGAMRRAARVGDGWYPTINNPSRDLGKLTNLQKAVTEFRNMVKDAGRDPNDLALTLGDVKIRPNPTADPDLLFAGDYERVRKDVRAVEDVGISYLGFNIRGPTLEETLANMGKFANGVMDGLRS